MVKGEDKIYRGYCEKAWNMRGGSPRKGVAEFILRGTMTKKFITLKKNIKAQEALQTTKRLNKR